MNVQNGENPPHAELIFSINLNTQKHQTGIIQKYSAIGDIMRFNNSYNLARICSIFSSDLVCERKKGGNRKIADVDLLLLPPPLTS